MGKYFRQFVAEFESEFGDHIEKDIEADSLEDATIQASTLAEENGYDFLSVDYANKNI